MKRSYIIAGGGTSGHINPALAIAAEIKRREPDAEIAFCGTARGLESEMVPRAGFKFYEIRARGLPRKLSFDTISAVREILAGRKQCKKLIQQLKPDAVIGTGGYVCSPLISAAAAQKVPALLHEQNAYPGRSNRMLARRCQAVCISFPGTEKYFRTDAPLIITGNPVRQEFFATNRSAAREKLNISHDARIVLVMGGSLGSATLNSAAAGLADVNIWQKFVREDKQIKLVLAAGRQHYDKVSKNTVNCTDWLQVHEYLYDTHLWMAAADLTIARAGAMTCAELAALGRAAILVPYPYAAGDHQTYNARSLVNAGAAIMRSDDECSSEWLAEKIVHLFSDPEMITKMGYAANKLAKPQAAADIYDSLVKIIK
jgi:UDP-N-acetylglucosamine--N-acetylmuramyl-(pentapeptide) pyrophosphoryl-undecaprenol N-acetylglucosamine transferase